MPSASDQTPQSLLVRIREQDAQAWQRFVSIYGPLLYGWARKAGVQPSDAADVVQNIFTAVFTRIETFHKDQSGGSLRAWLWIVCKNKIHDYFRERQSQPNAAGGSDAQWKIEQLPDTPAAEDSEEGSLEIRQLRLRAIMEFRDQFDEHLWEAFWRVVIDEQSPADVANDLGVSVWVVYKAKVRVLRRLRQKLEGLIEFQ